ncbi:MAG: hypothetical protein IT385_15995 [Deltaproteobacteria bacterium]|nr:hypothetical protein [Deltaproteobacteria bacterium]
MPLDRTSPDPLRATLRAPTLITLALFGAVLATSACDTGLQGKLNEARDKRYAAARAAVYKVEDERLALLEKDLPGPEAEFVGDEHPLLAWRKKLLDRTDDRRLLSLAQHARPTEAMLKDGLDIGARGTPSQVAAELGAAYVKESVAYWTHNATMARYSNYLGQFFTAVEQAKQSAAEKQEALAKNPERVEDAKAEAFVPPPMLDEARFDQVFMHAVKYFNLLKLVEKTQSYSSSMTDYEIAFDFPKRGQESFSDFVSRICFMHEGLKERCGKIPHEHRAAVVDHAYLEWLLGRSKALVLTDSPRYKVFTEVNARLQEAIAKALTAPVETKEEPVYPSTHAVVSGMSGVDALFSDEQGVQFNGVKLADKFGGALPDKYAETVKTALEEIKNMPGNRIDFQRVVLRMPGNVPFGTVVSALQAYPNDTVKQIFLVGRRRVDESMRLAALPMRQRPVNDSDKISYKFMEDAAETTCGFLGIFGDSMTGKPDEWYLRIEQSKIRATKINEVEETPGGKKIKQPTETVDLGTPADLTKLQAHLDANPGRYRTFIDGPQYSYDAATELLSQLLFKCKDQELVYNDPAKKPVTRKCGELKDADRKRVTLILGVCGG